MRILWKIALVAAAFMIAFTLVLHASDAPAKSGTGSKISMAEARKSALASSNGKIKSEELEKENGRQIYSFDIVMPDGLHEVNVDAASGKLIDDKVEDAAAEAAEAAQDKKEAAMKAKKAKKAAAAKSNM